MIPLTKEELAQKRADADLRERIKRLFNTDKIVREDAHEALREAWSLDQPSFDLQELATMDPQSATLSAMRRDAIREVVTWLTNI